MKNTNVILSAMVMLLSACASVTTKTPVQASQDAPVIAITVVPVSRSVQSNVDMTPGLAGVIMNIINIGKTAAQSVSDKYRIVYMYRQPTLLNAEAPCMAGAAIVNISKERLAEIRQGDYLKFSEKDGEIDFERVKSGDGTIETVTEKDYCYTRFQAVKNSPANYKSSSQDGTVTLFSTGGNDK